LPEKKEKQMRRTIALLTTMVLTLLVATSVAMAAVISCPTGLNGTCRGTASADTMTGTAQRDIIDSFRGRDTLDARRADDSLNGGQGDDSLNGGQDNDDLIGGQDNDSLDGGLGNDEYLFQDDWGVDTITGDASGKDTLDFSKLTQSVVVKTVPSAPSNRAKSGTNTLNWDSTGLVERIIGGAGNDIFYGPNVDTSLIGAAGNDVLVGGNASDFLSGGVGSDLFVGAAGNDTIRASDRGADGQILCGAGFDTVFYDQDLDFPDQFRDCEKKIVTRFHTTN
jgi:Ca2+-binding RTX toxin-like protein